MESETGTLTSTVFVPDATIFAIVTWSTSSPNTDKRARRVASSRAVFTTGAGGAVAFAPQEVGMLPSSVIRACVTVFASVRQRRMKDLTGMLASSLPSPLGFTAFAIAYATLTRQLENPRGG